MQKNKDDQRLKNLEVKYSDSKESKHLCDLIYHQRKYDEAMDYLESNIDVESLEYNYFKAKIHAYRGEMGDAIRLNGAVSKSENLTGLFYILDNAGDSQTLDLVNIGHDLRNRGRVNKSNQFMLNALNAQLEKKMINRTTVVQSLINSSKEKLYLEIGVFVGQNFLQIQSNRKIGVDPVLRIKLPEKFKPTTHFYEIPSDQFFKESKDEILEKKADVMFIDGLHTYGQSLRDVINGLDYLKDDGVIVMHDCFPKCHAAAHPVMSEAQQMEGYQGFWNGDVFKAILWMRSFRDDLEVFVLDTDHGLGMVCKGKPQSTLSLSAEQIEKMTYEEFAKDQVNYLNLKEKEYFLDWHKQRMA